MNSYTQIQQRHVQWTTWLPSQNTASCSKALVLGFSEVVETSGVNKGNENSLRLAYAANETRSTDIWEAAARALGHVADSLETPSSKGTTTKGRRGKDKDGDRCRGTQMRGGAMRNRKVEMRVWGTKEGCWQGRANSGGYRRIGCLGDVQYWLHVFHLTEREDEEEERIEAS